MSTVHCLYIVPHSVPRKRWAFPQRTTWCSTEWKTRLKYNNIYYIQTICFSTKLGQNTSLSTYLLHFCNWGKGIATHFPGLKQIKTIELNFFKFVKGDKIPIVGITVNYLETFRNPENKYMDNPGLCVLWIESVHLCYVHSRRNFIRLVCKTIRVSLFIYEGLDLGFIWITLKKFGYKRPILSFVK